MAFIPINILFLFLQQFALCHKYLTYFLLHYIAGRCYQYPISIVVFNFACLQALEDNREGALATLQLAARVGFKDIQLAWTEPAFRSLRDDPAFQGLFKEMKN